MCKNEEMRENFYDIIEEVKTMVKYGVLHVHSTFSLHDSTQTPEEIIQWAAKKGCKNITLTDHGTLMGIDDFMDAGKKYNVNAIPGVEMYLENRQHLVMIAKNYQGYITIAHALRDANMHQVISGKNKSLVYPIMTDEILQSLEGEKNIIVTSACISGPVSAILLENKRKKRAMESRMERLKPKAEIYKESKLAYDQAVQAMNQLKEERKQYAKYASTTYLNRIKKKEIKLNTLKEQLNTLEKEKKEKVLLNIHSLEDEIRDGKDLISVSSSAISELDASIKEWINVRKENKKRLDKTKNHFAHLQELLQIQKELDQIRPEDDYLKAKKKALYLKEIFPNFYIELQYHGLEDEAYVMPILVRIAWETGIPLIAANDAHMTDQSEESIKARQIVRFNYFKKHQEVSEADRELYLKNDESLLQALSEVIDAEAAAEAIEHTSVLCECEVVMPEEKHYPKVQCDASFDDLLDQAREEKIKKGEWDEEHEERLKHEREIITTMGYVDYHMVVRDFCIMGRRLGVVPKNELMYMPVDFNAALRWIEEKGYRIGVGVGPGRGSAAGSLVCYLLGITNIDPVKYGLVFERFLNPERVTMPDIDTDIKTSLRPYIIQYIKWKYGEKAVSSISTTMTYAGRGAVQMASRDRADELYGALPNQEQKQKKSDYMNKMKKLSDFVPETCGDPLTSLDQDFKAEFHEEEEHLVWNRAKLIEGKVSGYSVHAGGIVISDNDDICDYAPLLWREDKQTWATQCDMIRVEEKGMLKMDLLGLNTLDCITDTIYLVWKRKGISIDIDHISLDDEVFREIYAKGFTNSVFQFESSGMKKMLQDFQPTCFEDIILLIAAYRPGPMQFLDHIIDVKQGRKKAEYLTPELEPILSSTYSAIIYQEQVLEIFKELAGYSLGQADLVRRAMSKKKTEKLQIERKAFIEGDPSRGIDGCVKRGIDRKAADLLFDEMMEFAKYAFNRSHAAAYAVVSYQTAWLKYHHTIEFLCAMFNNKDQESFMPIIEDCNSCGIQLLPPDINTSYYDFTVEGNGIRFGFSGIKGIKDADFINQMIVGKRTSRFRMNPYHSFQDFAERCSVDGKLQVNKGIMIPLIRSGVFDSITKNRVKLSEVYDNLPPEGGLGYLQEYSEAWGCGKADKHITIAWEKEYLGTLISENPLQGYREDKYYGCQEYDMLPEGTCYVMGYISHYEEKTSKSGNKMMIVTLQGRSKKITVLFMREKLENYREKIIGLENSVVKIQGVHKDGTIFAEWLQRLPAVKRKYSFLCDTIEKYNLLTDILKTEDNDEKIECLDIFTFFGGIEPTPIKRPILVQKKISSKALAMLKHTGFLC